MQEEQFAAEHARTQHKGRTRDDVNESEKERQREKPGKAYYRYMRVTPIRVTPSKREFL